MNNGPWFDEHGDHSTQKPPFITEQLKRSEFSMRDSLSTAKKALAESKAQDDGRAGWLRFELWSAYAFHPMWFAKDMTYRICRDRADKQWPEVVRDRLSPDGPTTRLIDIEEDDRPEANKPGISGESGAPHG